MEQARHGMLAAGSSMIFLPAFDATEIIRFLRGRGLAPYKIPDRVEFVDSFPQTGVGKVSKKALRAVIAEKLQSGA